VEFRVWDTARCSKLLRKRYTQPLQADLPTLAHRIADDIVAAYVGVRGVSATEIAFVSTRGGNPEIYVMGADGSNARAATANRSINAFPSWAPNGESILYTSYRYANRPLLYLSTRGRGKPGRVLSRLGSGAGIYRGVFGPTMPKLAVVMSDGDASEIFTASIDGSDVRRLTNNHSIDVSPTWSPDGSQLAFVSDRAGSPQIYVMNADGSDQRRLTYQGSYNANPAWSPDGRWIAYQTRIDGQFDIWLIDPTGTTNVPLVTNPRSDESPSWAPNSRKLAFSSTRRGRADIYVIDLSGENLLRLTENAGDNTSPAWGPFPR
jgi:TolB protein